MEKTTENVETKVIAGLVRFSYAHVWEPYAMEGSDLRYSVSLIIPKDNTELIAKIKKAINAALIAGKAKFGNKVTPAIKLPLRDGDIEKAGDDAYQNSFYIGASSRTKPTIVNALKQPITNEEDFYSGCYGYASINFYVSDKGGIKVCCGLNHLLKAKDGDFLGGKSSADADFAGIDVPIDDFLS